MAALMHDAMEDCGITKPELIERFGAPTADLVDGLTKLDKLQLLEREERRPRVLPQDAAGDGARRARHPDQAGRPAAQHAHDGRRWCRQAQRIARETLDIYAPIAHRLGLNQIYRELQELSFQHLYPWRHAALARRCKRSRGYRRDIVERVQRDVEQAFARARMPVQVSAARRPYLDLPEDAREAPELRAGERHLRLSHRRETLPECYLALGVLHQLYKPVPGRFKDYIAIPRPTATSRCTPRWSARWARRWSSRSAPSRCTRWPRRASPHTGSTSPTTGGSNAQTRSAWVRCGCSRCSTSRTRRATPSEFLEHVKIDLFPDAVYVFTPKSKILALPRGATPVDFAYAIHSDVGDHCVAAKVNGEPVALRTELRSGDVVEVITAPPARPNPAG
jgi:guanosine-3',5'-bis(diphosphate) 3'-pyrophosphohydrolase